MKIRLTGGGEGEKKAPTPAIPSRAEVQAANKFAKEFAIRKGLLSGENTHTGGQVPKFIDGKTGLDITGVTPPPVGRLSNKVPLYVKELHWDDKAGLPYYLDEKTGDTQYVAKELFQSRRFKKDPINLENPLGNIRSWDRSPIEVPSANKIPSADTSSLLKNIAKR